MQTANSRHIIRRDGLACPQEKGDAQEAGEVARKILLAMTEPIIIAGQQCHVTGSIGISIYPADAADEPSLMKSADTTMYFAKQEGRDNYQFYSGTTR